MSARTSFLIILAISRFFPWSNLRVLSLLFKYFLLFIHLQTLYTYPENWRAFKAQIAAQYSGAKLKVASTPPAFTFGQTNRNPGFLNNFPLGKVSDQTLIAGINGCSSFILFVNMGPFSRFQRTRVTMGSVWQRAMPLLTIVSLHVVLHGINIKEV